MTSQPSYRFNPPPGWPVPPDFRPPDGWVADPSWPTPPDGWQWWLPELDKAELKRQRSDEKTAAKSAEAFAVSPAGKARAQRQAGALFFQIALPLQDTTRTLGAIIGGDQTMRRQQRNHADLLGSIETEGWHLEHAGYVFEETGSVSRDKFMSSGQTASVRGHIVGVYLFRVTSEAAGPLG